MSAPVERWSRPRRPSGGPGGLPMLTMNAWLRFDGIRRGLRRAHPRTVLEVGTGEGALGAWLARRYDYTGVELDGRSRAAAVARLAAVGRGRIVERLDDVGGQPFDLVCAFEVLEHVDDDEGALRAWRAHVRPGGWLLLSVPAHSARYGPFDELVGHYRRYDRPGLVAGLEAAGFEPVRISSHGAGLGQVLERGRNLLAPRLARSEAPAGTPEQRTAGSGRLLQARGVVTGCAFAAVAAPFRLLQAPFADGEVGTGYVVLARRPA